MTVDLRNELALDPKSLGYTPRSTWGAYPGDIAQALRFAESVLPADLAAARERLTRG